MGKRLRGFCLALLMLCPVFIEPIQVHSQVLLVSKFQQMKSIEQTLAKIRRLDQYQVQYQLKNQNTGEFLLYGRALVDQKHGAMDLRLDFYPATQESSLAETSQQPYTYHLLSFQDLQRNYLALDSLIQPSFVSGLTYQQIGQTFPLEETFVSIPSRGNSDLLVSQLTPSLQLLPSLNQVRNFKPYQVIRAIQDQRLGIRSQRLGIPDGILNFDQTVSFYQRTDYLSDEVAGQNLNVEASLEWQAHRPFISWGLQLNGRLNQLQAVDQVGHMIYQYQSKTVSDKLTQYTFLVNPDMLTYQADFVGLVEDFDLNIFDHETAKYRAHNYQLSVYVEPLAEPLVEESDLNSLSLEDLNQELSLLTD